MNTDRLQNQLQEERQQGLAAVFGSAPEPETSTASPVRRRRKPAAGSKRNSWVMRAWYVQPETARRLRGYVNRQQEAGLTVDASDMVDQAISAWLDSQGV